MQGVQVSAPFGKVELALECSIGRSAPSELVARSSSRERGDRWRRASLACRVSPRDLAILPILPGSIATGSRSDTPPRQAPIRLRLPSASSATDCAVKLGAPSYARRQSRRSALTANVRDSAHRVDGTIRRAR